MRVLIDTQIILWVLFDSSKLTTTELTLLEDGEHDIVCSSISLFEISIKFGLGKLELSGFCPDELPDFLVESGYTIETPTPSTFASYHRLPHGIHRDPFDRMLIWECLENGYHLLSRDTLVKRYQKHGLKVI